MEEEEVGSDTDQDPSVLEVPAIKWAKYVGVKSVQYKNMGNAPWVNAKRAKQMGSWQRRERNGEEFLHKPPSPDDGNYKRSRLPKYVILLRKAATGQHSGRIHYLSNDFINKRP